MKFLPRSVAVLAAAAFFPIVAAAQQPAGQQPAAQQRAAQGRQPRPAAVNRPQFTEQQREQLRTIEEEHRAATQTAWRELGDLNWQLNEQLSTAQIDASKVNALRSAIVQKETALAQQRVDHLTKRATLLTAEQRQAMRGRGGAVMQRRQGAQAGRGMQRQRGMIGGGRGTARGGGIRGAAPSGRGGIRGVAPGARRGAVLREGVEDARLRAEIRRLEAQIEALRRRIR